MPVEKYLKHYPTNLKAQVTTWVTEQRLGKIILARYPHAHSITCDQQLRDYVVALKNSHMKKSAPLSKVIFDNKLHVLHNALGLHTYAARVQGQKIKAKNEIRIGGVFRKVPEPFLNMISVHELAHLKEKDHNKAFYRLCLHMLPNYHQLEFDMRLYLVHLELFGELY